MGQINLMNKLKYERRPFRHPIPSAATLKELYANAYFCAFPGCRSTLYKVDPDSNVRTLNSTAAHICARSENGPRWDPNQSEADNKSVFNLLALCREHSAEIDDPKKILQFPPEILREWKQIQLSTFDALAQGWNISEQDIKRIQKEIAHVENTFSHSVIELGGTGGSAPSAGGGGGGVLGSNNSIGGNGGNGGPRVNLNGKPGTAPGAGGGASGVFGDGAVAGNGGSGGELVRGTILGLQEGQVLRVQVGKGAKNGKGGEDSSISVVGENGELSHLLVAKGGKAGKPGVHGDASDFARSISPSDIDGGAKLSTLMLAEMIRVKGDLVTILDGGWGSFLVPSLPFKMEWPVYAAFHMNNLAVPTVIRSKIQVKDPNNTIVFEDDFLFRKLDEEVVRTHLSLVLSFEAHVFGIWKVEVVSGETVLGSIPIHVLAIPTACSNTDINT